jgi:hypothetical protein
MERARLARGIAAICAFAMLAAAGWLAWKQTLAPVAVLDAERLLTLIIYLAGNAVVMFAAAQPARYLSRPLGVRASLQTAGAALVNVGAAAFFAINAALGAAAFTDQGAPQWLAAFLVPAAAALFLFFANLGASPDEPDEISDEDIAEAALILTESQRRWSWKAVFEMVGFMALTRTLILAVYFVWIVLGFAIFEWVEKAFLNSQPLMQADMHTAIASTLANGIDILSQGFVWMVFVFVAVVPTLLVLSAAVWYRFRLRRERVRGQSLSQTAAARLMTHGELEFLRRQIERPLLAQSKAQRGVS